MLAAMFAGIGRALEQVTFGAAGAGAATTAGTLSVPYPADIVAGSFLVLHVKGIATDDPAIPADWSSIADSGAHEAYYKRAVGDETGNLDVTISGGGDAYGRMYRFSYGFGVEAVGTANSAGAGDTTIEPVDVTTLGPLRMAVQLMCAEGSGTTTIGAITGESGADYTEAIAEFADTTTFVADVLMSCQVAQVAAAAAITGGSATLGSDFDDQFVIGFAIIP